MLFTRPLTICGMLFPRPLTICGVLFTRPLTICVMLFTRPLTIGGVMFTRPLTISGVLFTYVNPILFTSIMIACILGHFLKCCFLLFGIVIWNVAWSMGRT